MHRHFSHEIARVSRRELLSRGGIALGALAAPSLASAWAAPEGAIDAHVHVWTPDVKRYPLAAGFSADEMQPPSFMPDELLAHARPNGVERIVLIQMSYYGFDNSYMLRAIRDYPGVFSGVAVIDERAADMASTMRELKKQHVRGFRIHPAGQAVDAWLFNRRMAALWKLGAVERLAMCALVNPEALPSLDKMCQRFPHTTLVLDHFARIGIDGQIRASDVDNLCRLARHKHAYVKVSAFYALGQKKAPYTDLGPMIRRLLGAFGRERLMWATDCPYQVQAGHNYRDSIELVRSRLDFLSSDDRQWLLAKTAQRVFFD